MQIQFITTHEEMQSLFDSYFQKSVLNYQPEKAQAEAIIMTGEEICKKFDITIQTLIRWRHKGKIPFMQIGSAVRYDLNKVIAAIEASKKKGVKQQYA